MQKTSLVGIWIGLLPHLFCCVMPSVLLVVNFVLGTSMALHVTLFDHNLMDWLFYASGVLVVATFYMQYHHANEHATSPIERRILWITTTLYVISLIAHLSEHASNI